MNYTYIIVPTHVSEAEWREWVDATKDLLDPEVNYDEFVDDLPVEVILASEHSLTRNEVITLVQLHPDAVHDIRSDRYATSASYAEAGRMWSE